MKDRIILFIIGNGHSGSTLLDKTLGSHSEIFSLGEIVNFSSEMIKEKSLCGCGRWLRECTFWNKIISKINLEIGGNLFNFPFSFNTKYEIGVLSLLKEINIINFLKLVIFNKNVNVNDNNALMNTRLIYDRVFEETNAKILVDSSKDLMRALLLQAKCPDYKFIYLHLIRDGRGVLYSNLKDNYFIDFSKTKTGLKGIKKFSRKIEKHNPKQYIIGWMKTIVINSIILNIFRKRKTLTVKYECFANNPEMVLKNILYKCNLDYENDMKYLDKKDKHIVCGNPSRINALRINKDSENWNKLDKKYLILFNRKAAFLNKLLVSCHAQEEEIK